MFTLTQKQKEVLLQISRKSICKYLDQEKRISIYPKDYDTILQTHCGAFVSVYTDNNLRGCIGRFNETEALVTIIPDLSISSAFFDKRFTPISEDDLQTLSIEISVLTPPQLIDDISQFEMGKHGIIIKKDGKSGTFLPQVADQVNWSKEEFLSHCAQDKAGIGWDGWKSAMLFTYEAIVFSDN